MDSKEYPLFRDRRSRTLSIVDKADEHQIGSAACLEGSGGQIGSLGRMMTRVVMMMLSPPLNWWMATISTSGASVEKVVGACNVIFPFLHSVTRPGHAER